MLTHLLFSLSALLFLIIFIITYFSYKKNSGSIRSKIYVNMIYFTLILTIIEIVLGITYIYDISIIFSLMWKLHSIMLILFIAALFYYLLASIQNNIENMEDLFWDSKKISIKNVFTIIFIVAIIVSIIYIKTYPMGLTMFYFYTNESINVLLIMYLIYILYNIYIICLENKKSNFEVNDYIVLFGTFILFVVAIIFEYNYPEISIYSTLFTLILILMYYFKENEDLLLIEELQKDEANLLIDNDIKINYLQELICDLESSLNAYNTINKRLESISLEELNKNISNLNYISNNLVDVLNTQNKYIKYRLDELVKTIQLNIWPYLKDKPIELTYLIDPNIPSILVGDYLSIKRIITILLINAIKHTNVGKISLNITGEKVKDGEIINIKVADTGMGIKKEDFNKVFTDNKDDYISNLALAKKNVESLNGKIYFESFYGAGTTFYASVMQNVYNETPIKDAPVINDNTIIKNYNNKKVLILDSEEYSANKLVNILRKYNFNIKCVDNGKDAINTIKCDEDYNLIIISDTIKDMDFIEVGKLFKKLSKFVKVPPLVALTINNDKYLIDNVYDEYLLKPISLKKLNEIIEKRCI